MLLIISSPCVWLGHMNMKVGLLCSSRKLIKPDTSLIFKKTSSFFLDPIKLYKRESLQAMYNPPCEKSNYPTGKTRWKCSENTWKRERPILAYPSGWPYQCSRDISEAVLDTQTSPYSAEHHQMKPVNAT